MVFADQLQAQGATSSHLHDAISEEGAGELADVLRAAGVGLAICRKIVECHSGTIDADGRPGEGASMIVELPVQQINPGDEDNE